MITKGAHRGGQSLAAESLRWDQDIGWRLGHEFRAHACMLPNLGYSARQLLTSLVCELCARIWALVQTHWDQIG